MSTENNEAAELAAACKAAARYYCDVRIMAGRGRATRDEVKAASDEMEEMLDRLAALASAQQRKPLTDEQWARGLLEAMANDPRAPAANYFYWGLRFAEREHGIKA